MTKEVFDYVKELEQTNKEPEKSDKSWSRRGFLAGIIAAPVVIPAVNRNQIEIPHNTLSIQTNQISGITLTCMSYSGFGTFSHHPSYFMSYLSSPSGLREFKGK